MASNYFHLFFVGGGGGMGAKATTQGRVLHQYMKFELVKSNRCWDKSSLPLQWMSQTVLRNNFHEVLSKGHLFSAKDFFKGKTNFSFCGNIFNPWKPEPWTNSPQIIYICFVKKVKVFIEPFDKYFTSYNEHLWVLNIFRDAFLPISGNYANTSRSR